MNIPQETKLRLNAEATDLADKLIRLRQFIDSIHFLALEPKPAALLIEQEKVMTHYHIILMQRLARA